MEDTGAHPTAKELLITCHRVKHNKPLCFPIFYSLSTINLILLSHSAPFSKFISHRVYASANCYHLFICFLINVECYQGTIIISKPSQGFGIPSLKSEWDGFRKLNLIQNYKNWAAITLWIQSEEFGPRLFHALFSNGFNAITFEPDQNVYHHTSSPSFICVSSLLNLNTIPFTKKSHILLSQIWLSLCVWTLRQING